MGLRMYKLYKNFDELCEVVVDKLEDNKIIGWFQGKSEFGPRALGNRSILANPTFDNKDHLFLNHSILCSSKKIIDIVNNCLNIVL